MCADGKPARARALLAEGLRLARDRNDRRGSAEWTQALAAARALQGGAADALRLSACAEALRDMSGAEIYPAEAMIQERFLATITADGGFAAALETARARSPEELMELAVVAATESGGETVASPAAAG